MVVHRFWGPKSKGSKKGVRDIFEAKKQSPTPFFIEVSEMADVPIDIAASEALARLERIHYPAA